MGTTLCISISHHVPLSLVFHAAVGARIFVKNKNIDEDASFRNLFDYIDEFDAVKSQDAE